MKDHWTMKATNLGGILACLGCIALIVWCARHADLLAHSLYVLMGGGE